MQRLKISALAALGAVVALSLAGCRDDSGSVIEGAYFGDGALDNSRVLARVNGYAITDRMVDLRLEELNPSERRRFEGPDGRRVFLRQMVDELLRTRAGEEMKLDRLPEVARVLIAQYRETMDQALRNELIKDQEPDIDAVRRYFTANRDKYVRLGIMHASHIECATGEEAEQAYILLTVERQPFDRVVQTFSRNPETKPLGGDLGQFNRGGFIRGVFNGKAFSERVWDFEEGIHQPFEFEERWHVVKVHSRSYDRPQTLEEAYPAIVRDMLPGFQQDIIENWQRKARAAAEIQYFGEYRPGQGKTDKELWERAFYVNDPQQKLDLLALLVDDYPDSRYAPNALFMAANIVLDTWGDRRQASVFLGELLRRYPDSEFTDDVNYILENMHKPEFLQPRSIEDLRQDR